MENSESVCPGFNLLMHDGLHTKQAGVAVTIWFVLRICLL
jgi:hypothetical protein